MNSQESERFRQALVHNFNQIAVLRCPSRDETAVTKSVFSIRNLNSVSPARRFFTGSDFRHHRCSPAPYRAGSLLPVITVACHRIILPDIPNAV